MEIKLTNKNFTEINVGDVVTINTRDMKFGLATDEVIKLIAQSSNLSGRKAHVIEIVGDGADAEFVYAVKRYKQAGERRVKSITFEVVAVDNANTVKLLGNIVSIEEVE